MTRAFALVAAFAVALVSSAGAHPTRTAPVTTIRDLSLEFVGQFQNSPAGVSPPTHVHYGYLSYVQGLPAFSGAPQDQTTALFTFFADAATPRPAISNGPLRIITRVGKLTIYRDPSTNGDFADPNTFRDGAPVLVAAFRQQVVNNTVTGSFTTFHRDTIIATSPFSVGSKRFKLGVVREAFRTYFSGQGNMPGPPSGYFAGYAVSG